ncbi:MAG: hypothetical protein ABSB78_09065 [Bacteroidota bacterium]
MNYCRTIVGILAGVLSLSVGICFSQQDTTLQKPQQLMLIDGSELIGNVISEDSTSVNFKTLSNVTMVISRSQVKSIKALQGSVVNGTYVRDDPNNTRLFFAPTARSLKSGQGYFSDYELFFPFLAIGVTDFLTLAGGISIFPGLNGQLIYLAPKITPIQLEKFNLAGGVLYITTTSGGDGVGIIYSVGSYGNQNASLTAGLGWGFYGSKIADKPIVMLGGELRISNSCKFITENWIPPNSDIAIISFGLRFFGENLAADLGFIRPTVSGGSGFPFIPWLGFAYNFGTPK